MNKYRWQITPQINQLLIQLEAIKLTFNALPSRPHFETNLRQHSLLKSAVFSAQIEGFTDTLTSQKKESQNLLAAYRYIFSVKTPHSLTIGLIRHIHELVLKDITLNTGNWRKEPWAVFDQSGNAIYLAPPAPQIPSLMSEYAPFINKISEHPAVKAAISQFVFEKIHPFADGNGRVGRLISAFILEKNNLNLKGLAPFEEYLNSHRQDYYLHLEPSHNCTGFIEFFLNAIVDQSKNILEKLNTPHQDLPEDSLMPRRREILEIIRDHPQTSFDFMSRRFALVPASTLHHDIAQLIKAGYVRKLGKTSKVVYVANN